MTIHANVILQKLTHKKICFDKLLVLSEQQYSVVKKDSHHNINGIIHEKGVLFDRIKKIDKELFQDEENDGEYAAILSIKKKIKKVVEEIIVLEDECKKNLENERSKIAAELRGLNKGKQIMKGYSLGSLYKKGLINIKR